WREGINAAYDWRDGGGAAYSGQVFVTPPLDGWVLFASKGFFRWLDGIDRARFTRLVPEISRHLGTSVQFFATYRVAELHGWGWAERGRLVRAYAFLGERGETLLNTGEKTSEEVELGLNFFDPQSPEADQDGYWYRQDLTFPSEETVMQV